jgi:hypothetical protein
LSFSSLMPGLHIYTVTCMGDYRWVWIGDSIFLTTYRSQIKIIMPPLLISTLYKSVQLTLSLISLLSLVISWQQILTTEIPQLLCSRCCPFADTDSPHSSLLYILGMDCIQNSDSNSSSIIVCAFVSVGTRLFAKALISNGSCIFVYLVVIDQQQVYILQY